MTLPVRLPLSSYKTTSIPSSCTLAIAITPPRSHKYINGRRGETEDIRKPSEVLE